MSHPVLPGCEAWSVPGSGPNADTGFLLVHGFTGNPGSLRPLAQELSRRGFAVELPRLPGHGTHYRDMQNTRYADWRAEAEAGLRRLTQRADRVVLLGLSMGGAIVLDLAGTPEPAAPIAGVVTVNAAILDREGLVVKLSPLIEKVMPLAPASAAGLVKNDIKKPGVSEEAYEWVPTAAGNSYVRALPEIRARLQHVRVPLLVFYSREDHSVPPKNSQALPGLVGTTDVTVVVLEDSYHVATLDNDLPVIVERSSQFAERVAAKFRARSVPPAP